MQQIAATRRCDKSSRLHCCCDKSLRQDTCSSCLSWSTCANAILNGFLRDHGKIIDAPSLVDFNFVAEAYTRYDKAACAYFVAAICRTNSNQFEFVRQIAATKFCRSDNDFHMPHEAISCSNLSRRRVAAICRMVCLGLKE